MLVQFRLRMVIEMCISWFVLATQPDVCGGGGSIGDSM